LRVAGNWPTPKECLILLVGAEGYLALRRKIALLPIDNRAAKDAISLQPVAEAELW